MKSDPLFGVKPDANSIAAVLILCGGEYSAENFQYRVLFLSLDAALWSQDKVFTDPVLLQWAVKAVGFVPFFF